MALEHPEQRVRDVAQEVPAVGHLDRLRGAAADAVRIGSSPVARHDRDAGVPKEPGRQGVGVAVGQEVHDLSPLEVA